MSVITELVDARAALLDLHDQIHAGKPADVTCDDWGCYRYHDAMRAVANAAKLVGVPRDELDAEAMMRRAD